MKHRNVDQSGIETAYAKNNIGHITNDSFEEDDADRRKTLRRTEDQLIKSHTMANSIVEHTLNGIVVVDSKGNIKLWNKAAERLFGYSKKEAIGEYIHSLIMPVKYKQTADSGFQKFLKTGQGKLIGKTVEIEALRKDGSLFPIEISISAIMLKGERYAMSVIRDITKRKSIEKALKDSEEDFRLLSEESLAGVYVVQGNLFRYVNPAFGRMFGYTPCEIIDKLMPYDLIIPEDYPLLKTNLAKRISGAVKSIHYYLRGLRKDGVAIEFEVLGSKAEYKGKPAIIGTILDVTERRKKEHELQEEKLRAEQSALQFKQLSYLDGLTNIYNRRMFDKIFSSEWNRAKRNKSSLGLIMIDIDLFKGYNDTYGHVAGDRCLEKVADAIKNSLFRSADSVSRYGGEEFAVILPATKINGVMMIVNRIKANVEALHIPYSCSPVLKCVTISLGCASLVPHNDLDSGEFIKMADLALYRAKNGGRNRVEFFKEGIWCRN